MRAASSLLALLSVSLAGASTYLVVELGAEQQRAAELTARIARLEEQLGAAGLGVAATRSATGTDSGEVIASLRARGPQLATTEPTPRVAAASGQPSSAVPAVVETAAVVAEPVAVNAGRTSGLNWSAGGPGDWMRDPAARDAMRRQQLAGMRRMFPDVAGALGLSTAQAEQFMALTVDQQMRMMDESRQLATSGLAPGSGEWQEMRNRMRQVQREHEAELEAQFGTGTARRWQEYQASLPARMEVRNLQVELVDAGKPLTVEQRDRLVAAMTREMRASPAPATPNSTNSTNSTRNDASRSGNVGDAAARMQASVRAAEQRYAAVRASAASILDAEQLERFDQQQRERLEMMRASAQLAAQRANAAPLTPAGAAAPGTFVIATPNR